jgi:hypothetical protein
VLTSSFSLKNPDIVQEFFACMDRVRYALDMTLSSTYLTAPIPCLLSFRLPKILQVLSMRYRLDFWMLCYNVPFARCPCKNDIPWWRHLISSYVLVYRGPFMSV